MPRCRAPENFEALFLWPRRRLLGLAAGGGLLSLVIVGPSESLADSDTGPPLSPWDNAVGLWESAKKAFGSGSWWIASTVTNRPIPLPTDKLRCSAQPYSTIIVVYLSIDVSRIHYGSMMHWFTRALLPLCSPLPRRVPDRVPPRGAGGLRVLQSPNHSPPTHDGAGT